MPSFTSTSGADNPNNVARDRHGRYIMPKFTEAMADEISVPGRKITPDPKAKPGVYTRVSTIAKTLEDGFGISAWQRRLVVKGLGLRPDLYALACATRVDDRDQLDNIADQAHEAAGGKVSSNLGTALHSFTDRVDQGEKPVAQGESSSDLVIPEPWLTDVLAYQAALVEHSIELMPGYQEMRVVIPELAEEGKTGGTDGAAGTFDRIVMWRGRPTVADLKTGNNPLKYGDLGISIQLGRYATAAAIWDGESFYPMPEGLRTDVGLVIWLPAGQGVCEVHEVDLEPGHEVVAEAVMRTRAWRKRKGTLSRKLEPGSEEVESWKTERTPQQIEDQATADRRLAQARSAKYESEGWDDGGHGGSPSEGREEHPELYATVRKLPGADGEPVKQEREHDVNDLRKAEGLAPLAGPGERGCSVCGRKGHRKGSVKCLGSADPAVRAEVEQRDAGAQASQVANGEAEPDVKPHAHRDWTRDAMTGKWVCGICGEPGAEPITEEPEVDPLEGQDSPTEHPEADPFEDDEDPHAAEDVRLWMIQLTEAKTKADIRDIRSRARAAGVWDQAMLDHAMAQLTRLN